MKKFLTLAFLVVSAHHHLLQAQNVGIGVAAPNAAAKLEITDATRGLLIPRVALLATNNGTSPVATNATSTSLLVYNTATAGTAPNNVTPGFYYWNGTLWVRLLNSESSDWKLLGNAGTVAATNFVGTTDAIDLRFRTNNTERAAITSAGLVGIGTVAPIDRLSVSGAAVVGATYAATNIAPTNGLRVEGKTVINKASGEDARDIFSAHTSATAYSNVVGYPGATGSRAIAGYASGAGSMGIFGFAPSSGYGVVGLTQAGTISPFVQTGEGVLGQADGTALGIPIGVHGIIDETVVGDIDATPVLGENNTTTIGLGFQGGAYGTNKTITGVYGNIGSRQPTANTNSYMFGVVGDILTIGTGTIPDGSGGVLGFGGSGNFGMLGYRGLTGTIYSVYGGGFAGSIGAGNTGNFNGNGGNNNSGASNRIGLGIAGGFMGGYVGGERYGLLSQGEEFGMYVQGKTLVNQPIVQLSDNNNGGDRIMSYAATSTKVDVSTRGRNSLQNGTTFVPFDAAFAQLVNSNEPIIITVTPTSETKGVYVSQVTAQGFYVQENGNGTSNANFNWIAVGTRNGFENGVQLSNTILSNSFDSNMRGVMHNDGFGEQGATPIYFDGQNVRFERMPEALLPVSRKAEPNSSNNNQE